MLLKDQVHVSPFRGMPVYGDTGIAVVPVTGETVQFYYSNAGVRTADAGQAAGVAVEAVFARSAIRNKQGKTQGSKVDSSLTFTSTAFTTEVYIDLDVMERSDAASWAGRLAAIVASLNNGEYVVDYNKGIAYGKKASTQTTLTAAAYNIETDGVSGLTAVTSSVAGYSDVLPFGVYNSTPPTLTNGQAVVMQMDSAGNQKVTLGTSLAGENLPQDVVGFTLKPTINSAYGFNPIVGLGAAITASVAVVPTMLKSISATNANAALRYLQVFNSVSAPTTTVTVPMFSWVLPAGTATVPTYFEKIFDGSGKYMSAGLQWAISTTPTVYTNGATASEHIVNGEYI